MELTVIRENSVRNIPVRAGERLIEALERADIPVSAPCGGRCFCGKCRILAEGDLSPVTDAERRFLSEEELKEGWRLACACSAEGDVRITLPEAAATVLLDGTMGEVNCDPLVRIVSCEPERPSLKHQQSDAARLAKALGIDEDRIAPKALRKIPEVIRSGERIHAVFFEERVVDVCAQEEPLYGIAVDIGTTTLAAYLMDLKTAGELSRASMLNPQRSFGGDVITRADHTMRSEGGLRELTDAVRGGIRTLTGQLCRDAGTDPKYVRHMVLVGNTVMQHLAAGLPVRYIATLPFVPVYSDLLTYDDIGEDLGCANAIVTFGPCVAGYVGGDTVAAALACSMDRAGEDMLMMDIGTNGEMVLRTKDGLRCCATAAGPAFEGAHIVCGTGAVEGAISGVSITDGSIAVTTVGGKKACGICGSGIVSAVSEMLRAEIIDETGYLEEESVELAEGVAVYRKDIREVQLAKAAIAAGAQLLAEDAGTELGDVKRVCLAGGFGNYIDRHAACGIGLIPQELEARIEGVGNAAGAGAKMMLLDRSALARARQLRDTMRYIELSASPDFQERFAEQMFFGEE